MSNVNLLMNLKEDGTSRYNDLGLELDRKVGDALRAILEEAIEDGVGGSRRYHIEVIA
jgi:hypothetical protein